VAEDCRSALMLERLTAEFETLRTQREDLHRHMRAVVTALYVSGGGSGIPVNGAFDDAPGEAGEEDAPGTA
jgi:hypothetical protein